LNFIFSNHNYVPLSVSLSNSLATGKTPITPAAFRNQFFLAKQEINEIPEALKVCGCAKRDWR
jgi:hypothetical protein